MASPTISTTRGFSILELVVAFSLLSIVLVFSLQLYFFNQDSFMRANQKERRMNAAVGMLKEVQTLATNNFSKLISATSSIDGVDVFVEVETLDPFSKQVSITASTTKLERKFFDLARKGEHSSCAFTFSHSWNAPLIAGATPLSGSSTATSIKVQNGFAYVGADSAKASDPDLYIFDISDPAHMTLVSSLNTGPGVLDVALSWPYLFQANQSVNAQLQVVDVSNPANPVLAASLKLPGGNDGGYVGNSISINKNILALGTKKSDGPELHFIDISTPVHPSQLSSFEFNTAINATWIEGESVFVATPLDEELSVISIEDKTQPLKIGGLSLLHTLENGKSLYVLDKLYFGRTLGKRELVEVDMVNPSVPIVVSSTTLQTSINSLFVRDGYIFLGTIDPLSQFQIWKTHSTSSPTFVSKVGLEGKTTDIDCDKETIFVTTSAPFLYSIK